RRRLELERANRGIRVRLGRGGREEHAEDEQPGGGRGHRRCGMGHGEVLSETLAAPARSGSDARIDAHTIAPPGRFFHRTKVSTIRLANGRLGPPGRSWRIGRRIMDMKLEVVVLPVSDVDRAKRFYERLGWRLDADFVTGTEFRVLQFTPPGSEASIH